MKRMVLVLAGLLVLTLAPVALAQEKPAKAAPAPKKTDGAIDLGEEKVEGKVKKPEVFYVLVRQRFRYEDLSLKKSFVDLILKSARSNPF